MAWEQLTLGLPESPAAGLLEYWRGYSWTSPPALDGFAEGTVATPRWAGRVTRTLMLDNGAFPAWRDGQELSFESQVEAMGPYLERSRWVVAPDIVAGGAASWSRSLRALRLWWPMRDRLLLPLQEGISLDAAIEAGEDAGGLFIGGATHGFKIAATRALRDRGFAGRIHVGRIAKPRHLAALCEAADSIDNTTWVRAQVANQKIDLALLLRRFIRPR